MKKEPKTFGRAERHATESQPVAHEGWRRWQGGEGGVFTPEDIARLRVILDAVAAEFSSRFEAELGWPAEVALSGCAEFIGEQSAAFAGEDGFEAAAVVSGRAFSDSRIRVAWESQSAIGLVERLMGGKGPSASIARPVTEGERAVLNGVHETFCRSLEGVLRLVFNNHDNDDGDDGDDIVVRPLDAAASPVSTDATGATDAAGITDTPDSKDTKDTVLVATFDVLSGAKGNLKLVVPHRLALRLAREWPAGAAPVVSQRQPAERLRASLLNCAYAVTLELPPVPVKALDLSRLKVGEVLVLSHNIDDAGVLCAGGRAIFTAFPVRSRERRAAQLDQRSASL